MTAVEDLELPDVDLGSSEFEADPYLEFARARRQSWLARTGNSYAVLTHADARAIMRHPDFRVSFGYVEAVDSPLLAEKSRSGLMSLNGPSHVRLRGVVVRALRQHVAEGFRKPMRDVMNTVLDTALQTRELDLVGAVTDVFPALVMMPLLGVPLEDVPRLDRWATDSLAIFDMTRFSEQARQLEESFREFRSYVAGLIGRRREELGDDVISELIRVQEEGERLSEEELGMLVMTLVPAALDTTRGQLGFLLEALVRHPDQWRALIDRPELVEGAVEEGLRFCPAIGGIPHEVVRDTVYRDVVFRAGTLVGIHPRSVNRDPNVFEDPDTFDVTRTPYQHFTFGFGAHACAGSQVARMEMIEALIALVERVESWALVGEVTHRPMSSNGNRVSIPVAVKLR